MGNDWSVKLTQKKSKKSLLSLISLHAGSQLKEFVRAHEIWVYFMAGENMYLSNDEQ